MNTSHTEAVSSGLLTDEQIQQWDTDGFVVMDRFLDESTLTELRSEYDDILAGNISAAGDRNLGGVTRQVMRPSEDSAVFDDNGGLRRGFEIARQIFGTQDVVRSFDMLIYKPAGHPHDTPWHQDASYLEEPFAEAGRSIPNQSIQFWIPLDDVDTENGCMQFVAGYHKDGLLPHYVASGDPDDNGRLLAIVDPESQVDLSNKVVAEIPAGGATMHSFGTVHFTGRNQSRDRQRRSYIFNVVPTDSPLQ